MSDYYDRQGKPMTREEFIEAFEHNDVKQTTLPNKLFVSTVWLGINHNFDENGPPLIFETMVFPEGGSWTEKDCARYATEAEALAGHEAMVKKWSQM